MLTEKAQRSMNKAPATPRSPVRRFYSQPASSQFTWNPATSSLRVLIAESCTSLSPVADLKSKGGNACSSAEVADLKSRGGVLVKLIHVLVNKLQDRLDTMDETQPTSDDAQNSARAVIQSTYRLLEAIEDCHLAGHEPFIDGESRREMLLAVFSELSILGRVFVSSEGESIAVSADERTSADDGCVGEDPWAGETVLATEQLFEWFADFLELSWKRPACEDHDLDTGRHRTANHPGCPEDTHRKSDTESEYPVCDGVDIKTDVSLGSASTMSTTTVSSSIISRLTGWSVSSDFSMLGVAEGSASRSPSVDLLGNVPKLPSQQLIVESPARCQSPSVVNSFVEPCQSHASNDKKSTAIQAMEAAFFSALEPLPGAQRVSEHKMGKGTQNERHVDDGNFPSVKFGKH